MPTTTNDISAVYVGSKPVSKLYSGSTEIWSGGGGGASSTPTYLGSSTRVFNQPSTANHTLPTCAVGDLRVINVITLNTSVVAPATPAGWLVLNSQYFNGIYEIYSRTYYRVKVEGDSDVVTLANGGIGNTYASIVAHAFTNVDPVQPIGASTSFVKDNVEPAAVTAAGVTTQKDGCLVVNIVAGLNVEGLTGPSAGTEVNSQLTTNNFGTLTLHDAPTAGVYGESTWSATTVAGVWQMEVTTFSLR